MKQQKKLLELLGKRVNTLNDKEEHYLSDMIYTAEETGLLDYHITTEEAVFLASMVIASSFVTEEEIEEIKM